MQQRADALGFAPAQPDDITYVIVPGYVPHGVVDMSVHGSARPAAPVLLPAYSESLFDWLTRQLASSVPAGDQP
jgi:hypothetical protein